jgi:hypothetical protein
MPFIRKLIAGAFELEKFKFYIAPDSKYLEHFGRALALIGAWSNRINHVLDFIRFAEGCMLAHNKAQKVFNDNTHVLGNWSEAAEWTGKEWFPAMEEAGLRYFAWIFSPSAFSKLATEKSVDLKVGHVITQFFTDIAEADLWLEQCI